MAKASADLRGPAHRSWLDAEAHVSPAICLSALHSLGRLTPPRFHPRCSRFFRPIDGGANPPPPIFEARSPKLGGANRKIVRSHEPEAIELRVEGSMEFVKPERLWLKEHPQLDEKWVQARVAETSSLLWG